MDKIKNFKKLSPKKYAIALCSLNVYGLILVDEKEKIKFSDGSTSDCWTGITCRSAVVRCILNKDVTFIKDVGSLWASRNPNVVGFLSDVENLPIEEVLKLAEIYISTQLI